MINYHKIKIIIKIINNKLELFTKFIQDTHAHIHKT